MNWFFKYTGKPIGLVCLTFVFVAVGNYLFTPPIFDYSYSSLAIKVSLAVAGMLILPWLTAKYLFKKEPAEFGWAWPKNIKHTGYLAGAFILINLPILIWLSRNPELQRYYRLYDTGFVFLSIAGVLLPLAYYIAEEFLFRGFLFLGLWPKLGWHSFWITSFIFALFHIGKTNWWEVFYSLLMGLALCYLTLKSKSFLPAALVHFTLALILNILINYAQPDTNIVPFRNFSP